MSLISTLIAKIELPDLPAIPRRAPSILLPDILMVLAGCLVVTTLVVLWAVFIRKPRDARSTTRGGAKSTILPGSDDLDDRKKRRRHRRKRREHRSRKPTLSETGGLPPSGNAPNPAE